VRSGQGCLEALVRAPGEDRSRPLYVRRNVIEDLLDDQNV